MKVLLYISAALFIVIPMMYFAVSIYYSTTNVIVHNTYMGIGKFQSSPKTFMYISLAIAFILLSFSSHISYKDKQEPYSGAQ